MQRARRLKLSQSQEIAAALLAGGHSPASAARGAGVHPSQLTRWGKIPAFAAAVAAARARLGSAGRPPAATRATVDGAALRRLANALRALLEGGTPTRK